MKNSNLNEINKEKLTIINGGFNFIPINIGELYDELRETRRKTAELRSIR